MARYLLRAAKLLYELRVWPRGSQARPLPATVDRGMPLADDADLARFLLHRLDEQAEPRAVWSHQPGPADTPLRRNVFVVYGRDDAARRAVFDFLRALDLRPLEWEALVRGAGSTAPFLSEAVRKGIELASAVVVLMTPEDIVQLHPELHEPHEAGAEVGTTMQARPNVLVELGMALAAKPAGTLVLMLGEQRPVTDLGGIDFIRVTDTPQCRRKIAGRLRQAGCSVDDADGDWLTAGDFANLAALRRVP